MCFDTDVVGGRAGEGRAVEVVVTLRKGGVGPCGGDGRYSGGVAKRQWKIGAQC